MANNSDNEFSLGMIEMQKFLREADDYDLALRYGDEIGLAKAFFYHLGMKAQAAAIKAAVAMWPVLWKKKLRDWVSTEIDQNEGCE